MPRVLHLVENSANRIADLDLAADEVPRLVAALAKAGFARGTLVDDRGQQSIQTNSKVGVVQIGGPGGWQVEVVPKFGELETFGMLQGLWALGGDLQEPDTEDGVPIVATEALHDFFVSWALTSTDRFLDRSLRREYRRQEEVLHGRVRGRILAARWPTLWATGRPFDVPCDYFTFDVDTWANRVVRAGVEAIERYLLAFRPDDAIRLARARSAVARLGPVQRVDVRAEEVRTHRYDALTRRYQPIHALCALLLEARGLGHQGDLGGVPFVSFGFDLARAFQELLQRLLERAAGEVEAEPRYPYRWTGSAGLYPPHLKPDYLLPARREVLDAKYKDVIVAVSSPGGDEEVVLDGATLRVNRADVYQAIAYTQHQELNAKRVTFVFPVCRGPAAEYPRIFHLEGFDPRAVVRMGVMHLGDPSLSRAERIALWDRQVRDLIAD